MSGVVQRFLFEGLDIRGAVVRLEDCWQHMQEGRGYPAPVANLLGEMAAVTALIAGQLKQAGRLTFQLRAQGAIQLLLIDCDESLRMRGMARCNPYVPAGNADTLLGVDQGGQLALILDYPEAREPYQSFVPLVGDSVAAIFEHYLEQSEQLASRLFLAANDKNAVCLFLQKLPSADERDPDGWGRLCQFAATVKAEELLELEAETLLSRLFHEEIQHGAGVRVYPAREVAYYCPEDRAKIEGLVLSLGQAEVEAILQEHGEVVIQDEICNRDYHFSAEEVAALFAAARSALH